jgi:hypothetical protein
MKLLIMQLKYLRYLVQEREKLEIFYLLTQNPVHERIIYAVIKVVGCCFLWSKTRRFLVTILCFAV